MSHSFHIGFVQMTSTARLDWNLNFVEAQFASGDFESANLVVLPEMFGQFGVKDQRPIAREETRFDGPIGSRIRQLAQKYNVWIVAGTVPSFEGEETLPRARCHVVNAEGELVTCYDKIHLFDANVADKQGAYRESASYQAGNKSVCFDSPWGRIGLAVCYDLRFPELFRKLNDDGAETVIVPSAFTESTGRAHWEVLCRARAIENGFFVAAVNQCGQHDEKRSTWGHSMLVSPWGEKRSASSEPENLVFHIDHSEVERARERIPVNENRRLP